MLEQYAEPAFAKIQENERLNLEDDPFSDKGEKESFYHGRLIYKSGEQVDYYHILRHDWFIAKSNKGDDKPNIMKGWDWRENVTDAHNHGRADENGFIGLPEHIESDHIIYESQNAREFNNENPRIGMI